MGNYIQNVANILYSVHSFKVGYIHLFSLSGFRLHFVPACVQGGLSGETVDGGHVLGLTVVSTYLKEFRHPKIVSLNNFGSFSIFE